MRVLVTLLLTLTEELADFVEVPLLLTLLLGVAESEGHAVRVAVGVADVVFVEEEEEDWLASAVADLVEDVEPVTVGVGDTVVDVRDEEVSLAETVELEVCRGEALAERTVVEDADTLTEAVVDWLTVGSRDGDTEPVPVFEADWDEDTVVVGVGDLEGLTEGVGVVEASEERLAEVDAVTVVDPDTEPVGVLLTVEDLEGHAVLEWLADAVEDKLGVADVDTVVDIEVDFVTDTEGVLDTEGVGVFEEEVDLEGVWDTLEDTEGDGEREGDTVAEAHFEGEGVWEDVADTDADFVEMEVAESVGALVEVSSADKDAVDERDAADVRLGVCGPVAEPVVELEPVTEGVTEEDWLALAMLVGVFDDELDLDTLVEEDWEIEGDADLEERIEEEGDTDTVLVLLAVLVDVSEAVVEGDLLDAEDTDAEADTVDVWLPVAVARGEIDADADAVSLDEGDTVRVDVFDDVDESEVLAERVVEGEVVLVADAEGVREEEADAVAVGVPVGVLLTLTEAVLVGAVRADTEIRDELDADEVKDADALTEPVGTREGVVNRDRDGEPLTLSVREPPRPGTAASAADPEKLELTLALGVEELETDGEFVTETLREPPPCRASALALTLPVREGAQMVTDAVVVLDSEGDTELEGVVRGVALSVVLSEALPLPEREGAGLGLLGAERVSEEDRADVREAAPERVKEPLTLGDRLAEAQDVELLDGTGEAEPESLPRRPLAVRENEGDDEEEALMVEDSDTVDETDAVAGDVEDAEGRLLLLADAALVCVLEAEEERDMDAEGVVEMDTAAVTVAVLLAVEVLVKGAEPDCDRLGVRDAESHWLLLIVPLTNGDLEGVEVMKAERETEVEPDTDTEGETDLDARAVWEAA